MDKQNYDIQEQLQRLESELRHQKKTTKNALKLSILIGVLCVFFVALNLSILFTIAGGIAGSDRKLNALQEQNIKIQEFMHNHAKINN